MKGTGHKDAGTYGKQLLMKTIAIPGAGGMMGRETIIRAQKLGMPGGGWSLGGEAT